MEQLAASSGHYREEWDPHELRDGDMKAITNWDDHHPAGLAATGAVRDGLGSRPRTASPNPMVADPGNHKKRTVWPHVLAFLTVALVVSGFLWFHVRGRGQERGMGLMPHPLVEILGAAILISAAAGLLLLERKRRNLLDCLLAVSQTSDQRFRDLVDGIDAIVWEAHRIGGPESEIPPFPLRFTFVSRQAEKILGYPVDSWARLPDLFGDVIHPEDREQVRAHFQQAFATGNGFDLEHRVVAADGREMWVRDIVRSVRNGVPVARLRGITLDITAGKRMETAIRESEERFRVTFEAAALGIAMVDLEGRIIETNRALQGMLGYAAEELRGRLFTDVTHPDDAERDRRLLLELVRGVRDRYQMEKRYLRKDGEVVCGKMTASLVRDSSGTPRFAIGMAEDVTEKSIPV